MSSLEVILCLLSRIEAILMSTHNIPFQFKKNHPYYPKSAAMGFLSTGLKNEYETAVVNEPSAQQRGIEKYSVFIFLTEKVFRRCAPR